MDLKHVQKWVKKNWVVVVVVAAVLFYLCYASEEGFSSGSGDDKKTVVLFYAPWCPHCTKVKPTFDELAKEHSGDASVTIKSVNCEENKKAAEENEIESYPTIILFRGNNKVKYESNDRSKAAIERFISSN